MCPIPSMREDKPVHVSELIDKTSNSWNMQLLNTFFIPMDQEVIRNILLAWRRQEDFWAWQYEKNGIFSVRSAYRMLVHNREKRTAWMENIAGRSDTQANEKEWTALWSVKVPSKLRIFLWRLAKQSIPTSDVLHKRNMAPQDMCTPCGGEDSWRHALLECKMARCVWALEKEGLSEFLCSVQEAHARHWLAAVMGTLKHEELTRVVVTLWAIWYARRKAIHENLFQCPLSTHCFVDRFVSELDLAVPKERKEVPSKGRPPRWIGPPRGLMKINVDAAIDKNSQMATASAVARDSEGFFSKGFCTGAQRSFRS